MDGKNPYIDQPDIKPPAGDYKINFQPMDVAVEVKPSELGKSPCGYPYSILHIALENGIDIDRACGGVCACATCHVFVTQGYKATNEPTEAEEDALENAPGLRSTSRLACCCVPDGTCDVIVEIPNWNRNLVKEIPH